MIFLRNYYVNTTGKTDVLNITHDVKRALRESGIANGSVTILIPGATAGVALLEGDPKIQAAYRDWVETQVPASEGIRPNRRSGTGKDSAHLRAAIVGLNMVLPVQGGKLMIGPWQEVTLLDFEDKAGRREITIQVAGDSPSEE
jgi:secondary thiamine-phosphate synthase enzyme